MYESDSVTVIFCLFYLNWPMEITGIYLLVDIYLKTILQIEFCAAKIKMNSLKNIDAMTD